jgi:hypothetical protein
VGTCSTSRLTPFGTIQTSQTQIDYGQGTVSVTSTHKVDVDVIEDGCVSRLELTLSQARGQCPLKLVFTGKNATFGGLAQVELAADSTCPGFLDAAEGVYTSQTGFAPWRYLGPQVVPQRMASGVCMAPIRLGFPDRTFRLYRSSPSPAELSVNLQGLELHGELFSKGNTNVQCFDASACGPGMHEGGDGWCVQEGRCSPGYHDGGDGRCVASTVCAAGYFLSPGGACTPWKSTTPLPGARMGAGSAQAGGHLFLVGGSQDGIFLDEVWSAPLLPEGGLGEWKATTPLPTGRHQAPVAVSGGYLYVVGGVVPACSGSCTAYSTEVLKAPLQADGTLGEWSVAGLLPDTFERHAVVSHAGTLYVVGGGISSANSRTVFFASLQPDGTLGAWKRGPLLPQDVRGHAALVVGDILYVVGGTVPYLSHKAVYRAPLAADGGVGSWLTSSLPYSCEHHTVETQGGYLYLVAGDCDTSSSTSRMDLIQYAPIGPTGALGTWTAQPRLEPGRWRHLSTVHGDFVYLLGGSTSISSTSAWVPHVQVARFRPSGGGVGP